MKKTPRTYILILRTASRRYLIRFLRKEINGSWWWARKFYKDVDTEAIRKQVIWLIEQNIVEDAFWLSLEKGITLSDLESMLYPGQ